jgi:urea transport system permease protein
MMRALALALALAVWLTAPAVGHAAAPAADVERALADLAGDDAERREAAVAVLGKTGDPRWLAFLAALREGSVYARTKGGGREFLIGGSKSTQGDQDVIEIKRAYEGTPLGSVPVADLVEVSADRRLRIAIKPFLDAAETTGQFADPDPNVRWGAAIRIANQADASAVPVVEQALAKETHPWVRHALAEALAIIRLTHGDAVARTAAATTLGGLHSLSAVPALRRLEADAAASPAERDAAAVAIKTIERWTLLTTTLETAFQGASLASILLLMALGLAIVFGLMGVINMAHGELMALGAYTTFVVQNWFRAS